MIGRLRSSLPRLVLGASIALLAAGVVACGQESMLVEERPPSSIEISARIGPTGVEVSPRSFEAGLANMTVANLTDLPAGIAIEGPLRLASDEIQPGGSTNLQGDFPEGIYRVVAVTQEGTTRTTFTVSGVRESSDRELLLP